MSFDQYLRAVMHNVFASQQDRERLEADLRAHFTQAEATGETVDRILHGLGTPEEVAAALNAERGIQYASFWQRLTAFIGDCGLLAALTIPAVVTAFLVQAPSGASSVVSNMALGAAGLVVLGLFV